MVARARLALASDVGPYITRFDYGTKNTHGWWVRVQRRKEGEPKPSTVSRFFADRKWGSMEAALLAAKDFRKAVLARVPASRRTVRRPKPTGYGYVRRGAVSYKNKSTGALEVYDAWNAWFQFADGRQVGTKYSIPKWGEAEARHKAEVWLERQRSQNRKLLGAVAG